MNHKDLPEQLISNKQIGAYWSSLSHSFHIIHCLMNWNHNCLVASNVRHQVHFGRSHHEKRNHF